LKFRAIMRIRGVNPYLLVSAARAKSIKAGWRKPMPVLVRINGKPDRPWAINMMPAGNGSFYLYLHGVVRKASGTGVGDRVEAEVEFDGEYRGGPQHPMPAPLRRALAEAPQARENWNALTPSRKKEVLRYLAHLKSPAARARNLARVTRMLSGEVGRFMGRSWADGV
jgi:bacteriocin resistance YdeI/OmpD-like protein/uncharacterized protein DUF1905